jgi:prepilin-type N-terminal cleavage/methylation domain-containing protein
MKNERGFTLVEMLVVIVLLSVLLVPMIGYFIQSRMVSSDAHIEGEATRVAQSQMESLIATPWEAIQSGQKPDSDLPVPFEQMTWTVSDEGTSLLKRLEVQVKWRDLRGTEQSYTMVTFRSSRQ